MRQRKHRRLGQTATEYMLVVSVVVIATVGASYAFVPKFRTGVRDLARDAKHMLATGDLGRTSGPPKPADCGAGSACGRPRDPFGLPSGRCGSSDRC